MNNHPNGYPNDQPNALAFGDAPGSGPIVVGSYLAPPTSLEAAIRTDDPWLQRHADRPWLRAWVAREIGEKVGQKALAGRGRTAMVGEDLLAHHAVIVGATGSGKTRLALHLLAEQMRRGRSVVALDPKKETITHLLHAAMEAGVPPDRVVLLAPGELERGIPGWNPLASKLPLHLVAADLVSVLEKSSTSWGPRLADILANALIVLAAHSLSLFELPRLLGYDDYREALLRKPPVRQSSEDAVAYREATAFFQREYGQWSKGDRTAAAGPVLNKTRELLRGAFFQALLCAERNTLDFSKLWQRQEIVLVHLDSSVLGSEGARILSGLIAHSLYRTAMRCGHEGPNSVVLSVDELGVQEEFLGSALTGILAVARSKNLRLMAACQHLSQVSPALREALLSQSAFQAFFRLGHSDAKIVGDTLAAEEPDRVAETTVRAAKIDRLTGRPHLATVRHDLLDGNGTPLAADPLLWRTLVWRELFPKRAGQPGFPSLIDQLKCIAAKGGIFRLYVLAADSGRPVELSAYVLGLGPLEYWFDGPSPMQLIVAFPKPKLSSVRNLAAPARSRNWAQELMGLAGQQAILRTRDAPAAAIRVANVPSVGNERGIALNRYAQEALRTRGRSWRQAEQEVVSRERAVENLAKKAAAPIPEAAQSVLKSSKKPSTPASKPDDLPKVAKEQRSARPPRKSAPQTTGRIADDGSIS